MTDFTAPVYYGSSLFPIVEIGVIKYEEINSPISYEFQNETYVPVIKSYITKLEVNIVDENNQPFHFDNALSPIILKFYFRLRPVI